MVRTTQVAPDQPEAFLSLAGLPAGLYTVRAGPLTQRLAVA